MRKSTSGATFNLTTPSSYTTKIGLSPCAPSITVSKTPAASPVSVGSPVAFDIQVTNAANAGPASNVELTDTLPAGLSWSIASGGAGCSIATSVLSCGLGTMAAGATFSVQVSATAAGAGKVTNQGASVTINGQAGPSSGSAYVDVVDTNLTVTKTPVDPSVLLGDEVAFDVVVKNNSSLAAHNVGLSDTLPAGLTWYIASGGAGCTIGSTLTCSNLTIAGNDSFPVRVTATSQATGTVTNDGASVSVNGQEVTSAPAADVNVFETTLPCGQSDTSIDNVIITNPAVDGCTDASYTATFTGTTLNIDKSGPTNLEVHVDSWAPEPVDTPVPATYVWPPDPNPHKGFWCAGTPGSPDPLGPGNTLHPPGNEVWCLVSQSTVLVSDGMMQVSEIWLLEGDAALCRKSSCN